MTDKKRTKLTKKERQKRRLEIYQQAITNLQKEGLVVRTGNTGDSFVAILDGYHKIDGEIKKCKK